MNIKLAYQTAPHVASVLENATQAALASLSGAAYTEALRNFATQGSLYTEQILSKFISLSAATEELLDNVRTIANHNCNVLIQGEQGTGKEMIARALMGSRKGQYVVVNCADITETLGLSQLFGHEKGSFTGATEAKHGLVRFAQDGALFLDEVADLSPATQTALLRLTEYRTFRPLGAQILCETNTRFIAATNKSLRTSDTFRNDLYSRMACVVLRTPAFREYNTEQRLEFFRRLTNNKVDISNELHHALTTYSWPGNIRELKNFVLQCDIFGVTKALQLQADARALA